MTVRISQRLLRTTPFRTLIDLHEEAQADLNRLTAAHVTARDDHELVALAPYVIDAREWVDAVGAEVTRRCER